MATNSALVRRGITGVLSTGPETAEAPTSASSPLVGYDDQGWLGQFPTRTLPNAGAGTPYRGFQNNGVVFTVRTPSDENPTYTFILLETKKESVELALGVTVIQTADEGTYDFDQNAVRGYKRLVFDVADSGATRRDFLPRAFVTEIGEQVFQHDEPIGWTITVEAERDPVLGFNIRTWDTSLALGFGVTPDPDEEP